MLVIGDIDLFFFFVALVNLQFLFLVRLMKLVHLNKQNHHEIIIILKK